MIDLTHLVDELASDDERDRDRGVMVSRLASGPKSRRQELIHAEFYYIDADDLDLRPDSMRECATSMSRRGSVEAQTAAAIEIQRIFRGYLSRCRNRTPLSLAADGVVEVKNSRTHSARNPMIAKADRMDKLHDKDVLRRNTTIAYMETEFKMRTPDREETDEVESPSKEDISQEESAISGKLHNDGTPVGNLAEDAVKTPQPANKAVRYENITPCLAALIIQRAWRKHIDVQVFRYYRDLINFKHKGDPALMLKCINPIESKLLDAAAGVHIKFRLAGHQFPPNIYYKIFTHRPVQDLCANSPKDYTKACNKRKLARYVHNRTDVVLPQDDLDGWYKRHENNGWRLVSDRLMQTYLNDETTYMTSMKKSQFSHTKLLRKEDIERKKKHRKIDWMRKMYKKGMLKAKVDDAETVGLINGAAAGMLATVDVLGVDAVHNWEVDELLEWTTGLNFDDYWTTWKDLATSAKSEKQIEDHKQTVSPSSKDAIERAVSGSQTRSPPSTRLSHNTPVSNRSVTSIPY